MKKSHKRSIQKRSDVAPLKNEVFVNIGFPHDMTISGTMNVEELARQLDCSSKISSSSFGNLLSPPLQSYKVSYGK